MFVILYALSVNSDSVRHFKGKPCDPCDMNSIIVTPSIDYIPLMFSQVSFWH